MAKVTPQWPKSPPNVAKVAPLYISAKRKVSKNPHQWIGSNILSQPSYKSTIKSAADQNKEIMISNRKFGGIFFSLKICMIYIWLNDWYRIKNLTSIKVGTNLNSLCIHFIAINCTYLIDMWMIMAIETRFFCPKSPHFTVSQLTYNFCICQKKEYNFFIVPKVPDTTLRGVTSYHIQLLSHF